MSLENYNLQQEQQSARQTGDPVDRYEYAQGLQEVTNAVVPLEKAFLQGYEQQQKKAAQTEDEVLLNEYRDKLYSLKSAHERKENPSPAEFQDAVNNLKNQFPTVAAAKLFAVDKATGIEAITPAFMQAAKTTEEMGGKRKAEVDKSYYDLGEATLGIDKASSMTPDAVIQEGKRIAAANESLNVSVDAINDPNSPKVVVTNSLLNMADILTDSVGEEVNNSLEAGHMITTVDLDRAKEMIVRAYTPKIGAANAVFVANRAVLPYKTLADTRDTTLEDMKKYSEQINTGLKNSLDTKMMVATDLTQPWANTLKDNPWMVGEADRNTINNAIKGVIGDREGNARLINNITQGDPMNLTKLGEGLDRALKNPMLTDKQKAMGLNAATEALSINYAIPSNINVNMPLEEISRVIKEDADTAADNFAWLNNKYQENSGAMVDTVNKSDDKGKVNVKNDYTTATLGTVNKKLLQAVTDAQGAIEYSNGSFKSSVPVDEALMNELNNIVSSAEFTNTAAGYTLLDRGALNEGIQATIRNYKLNKPNNLRGDQKAALLFTPVLASGQASHTERQQALLGNRVEEEPWLKTFQSGLTGAEIGGAAGAVWGEGIGAVPGAVLGGAAGLVGGAYQNFPAVREAVKSSNPKETFRKMDESTQKLTEALLRKGKGSIQQDIKDYLSTSAEMLQKGVEDGITNVSDWVDETALQITKMLIPDAGAAEPITVPKSITEGKLKLDNKERVKAEEGLRLKVYKDAKGNKTIGYGTKLKNILEAQGADAEELLNIFPDLTSIESQGVSEEQAEELLDLFLSKAELDAERFVGTEVFSELSPARQQALVDMAYNLGGEGLGKFKLLRQRIQEGNFNRAALAIERSDYAKQNSKRAKRNSALMKKGTF